MRWQDGRRGEVDDRRGSGGGGMGAPHFIGGGGIGVVIIALIGYFVFHIDPAQLLSTVDTPVATDSPNTAPASGTGACADEACQFVNVIHTSADDTWAATFAASGKTWRASKLVVYSEQTPTGCGEGQAAMGPFYCPADESVYIDLDFFKTLDQQLGAPGDFAKAYVVAHEVGHHVQNLLGISDQVQRQSQHLGPKAANALSVKLELQADCYAGVWAKQANAKMNWIEAGDIDEAMGAATAVGDDTLQKEMQGRVVPDSFTHGTSAARTKWFKTGFESGQPSDCNTFKS